jgi:hypothetical protein
MKEMNEDYLEAVILTGACVADKVISSRTRLG